MGLAVGKLFRDVGRAVRCGVVWPVVSGCVDVGKACFKFAEFPGLLMNSSDSMASFSAVFWWGEKPRASSLCCAGPKNPFGRLGLPGPGYDDECKEAESSAGTGRGLECLRGCPEG